VRDDVVGAVPRLLGPHPEAPIRPTSHHSVGQGDDADNAAGVAKQGLDQAVVLFVGEVPHLRDGMHAGHTLSSTRKTRQVLQRLKTAASTSTCIQSTTHGICQ
jgi:hypothetical protein